jgi:hypothetical protein
LGFHGVGAGAEEGLDAEMLLDPLEQLSDILPINTAPLKLLFTTTFIRCAHTACR